VTEWRAPAVSSTGGSDVRASTTELYHVGRSGHLPGSVVAPTRYVERLAVDDSQVAREAMLEMIRASDFPHLPSRNDVVFTWADIADARIWLQEGVTIGKRPGDQAIYVVAPLEGADTFRGDYGWLALTERSLDELEDRAWSYWAGDQRPGHNRWEVLVRGGARIERVVPVESPEPAGVDRADLDVGRQE